MVATPATPPPAHPTPADDAALRRRSASVRHVGNVNALLDRREELSGVVPLADLLHEASTWAA